MKALFSNWSEPQQSDMHAGYANLEDFKIGISTAIKCAARYYDCHFIGDEFSIQVVSSLNLPIKSYQILDLTKAPKGLWNYSKIKACQMLEPPFIHIDNDVFLTKKIPEFQEYLFQNTEDLGYHPWYKDPIEQLKQIDIPQSLFNPNIYLHAYNCGIIGIKSKKLINEWIDPTLKLIESKKFKQIKQNNPAFYEIVVEQYTAYCASKHYNRHVVTLLDDHCGGASEKGFIHMISHQKRKLDKMEKIKRFYKNNFEKNQ